MEQFQFYVQSISYGWCDVEMQINDKQIFYSASYIGHNPLITLIEVCLEFKKEKERCFIEWQDEPGILQIELSIYVNKQLRFDIYNKEGLEVIDEWHEVIPLDVFLDSVISEGFRVLNSLGIRGFRTAWQNDEEFPLGALLEISGRADNKYYLDACCSNLLDEVECLTNYMKTVKPQEERHYNKCAVYYESWQIQCCGEPFAVGDHVNWTGFVASETKYAHGFIIDFEENHHGPSSHAIAGTICKILAERSECPKGEREIYYHRASVIHSNILRADGYESEYKSDESTDRTFFGYIVILKDVVVKPLYTSRL